MIDLKPIEAREKAAIDGPWYLEEEGVVAQSQIGDDADIEDYRGRYVLVFDPGTIGMEQYIANLEFATGARQDIPDLIAEVKRLRGELEELRGFAEQCLESDPTEKADRSMCPACQGIGRVVITEGQSADDTCPACQGTRKKRDPNAQTRKS